MIQFSKTFFAVQSFYFQFSIGIGPGSRWKIQEPTLYDIFSGERIAANFHHFLIFFFDIDQTIR